MSSLASQARSPECRSKRDDIFALDANGLNKLLDGKLRMLRRNRLPALCVHPLIKAGQDHRAVFQSGNCFQQFPGGRNGAGGTRGDNGTSGRIFSEPLGFQANEAAAPLLRPHEIFAA